MELAHDGAHHCDGVDLDEVGCVGTCFGLCVQGGVRISIFIKIGPRFAELARDGANHGDGVALDEVGHV